jgi:hypothetical protein
MMHCVQCDTELVAPVRSEYWSDSHACYVWLCPKCCACFSSVVSFSNFNSNLVDGAIRCETLAPGGDFSAACRHRASDRAN